MMALVDIATLTVTSLVFVNEGVIPSKYTCDGENINPPLQIDRIPENTKSLALIVDDPDAPSGTWDHWVVWNIPVKKNIAENSIPGIEGLNSFGRHNYGGPCPPSGIHRYFFKVYALDTMLDIDKYSDKKTLLKVMEDHILAKGEIMGSYKRSQ